MKRPNRWERAAYKLRLDHIASPFARQIPEGCWPTIEHRIATFLRREHRAVVRMIKAEMKRHREEVASTVGQAHHMSLARWGEAYLILSKIQERVK